jgi:hypothetical protein
MTGWKNNRLVTSFGFIFVIVFLFTGLSAAAGFSAQGFPQFGWGGPKSVTIIGSFVPPQGTVKHGLLKLTVFINKEKRYFVIQNLWPRGWDAGTLEIINQITPPRLRFIGPPDILQKLGSPEMQGKVVRLVGDLYITSRLFSVDFEQVV